MLKQAKEAERKFGKHRIDDIELRPLIERALEGSSSALEQLCEAILDNVMFRATRIMYNSSDAEDVAQEALLRMCNSIQKLRDPKMFHTWLTSIIINESRRKMKSNSKTAEVLHFDDEKDLHYEENDMFVPELYVEDMEHRSEIVSVIDSLSLRQQQAVMLHYFDELNVSETAKAMGIPQPNVTAYLKNARNKIKSELEKKKSWSFERNVANGFLAVPFGVMVSNVFKEECLSFQADASWMSETLTLCKEAAFAAGGAANTATLAAEGVSVAGGAGSAGGAATATTALTGSIAAVAGTCATIVAAVAISIGITATTVLFTPEESEIRTPVSTYASAQIAFASETDLPHINPISAQKISDSAYGQLDVLHWQIRDADGGQVLYSGEGSIVEDIFEQMLQREQFGTYYLEFFLEDAIGARFSLGHNFVITGLTG